MRACAVGKGISSHITNIIFNISARIKNPKWQEAASRQFTSVPVRIGTLADRKHLVQLEARVRLKLNLGSWDCESSMSERIW